MRGRRTNDLRRDPIGHDEPGPIGEEIERKSGIDREIQAIAIRAVIGPFLVGLIVARARLDLDADEAAIRPQGEKIGAAAIGQPHLVQERPAQIAAQPGRAPADGARDRGRLSLHQPLPSSNRASAPVRQPDGPARFKTVMAGTRFAVATHILVCLAVQARDEASTSLRLAESVNTNPVVIRRISSQLARAGLIRVRRGPGGAALAREPERITLEDVWLALHGPTATPLLPLHRPSLTCPVGGKVRPTLGEAFATAERALHRSLAATTLAALAHGLGNPIT